MITYLELELYVHVEMCNHAQISTNFHVIFVMVDNIR